MRWKVEDKVESGELEGMEDADGGRRNSGGGWLKNEGEDGDEDEKLNQPNRHTTKDLQLGSRKSEVGTWILYPLCTIQATKMLAITSATQPTQPTQPTQLMQSTQVNTSQRSQRSQRSQDHTTQQNTQHNTPVPDLNPDLNLEPEPEHLFPFGRRITLCSSFGFPTRYGW